MYDNCSGLCLKTCLELSYFKKSVTKTNATYEQ